MLQARELWLKLQPTRTRELERAAEKMFGLSWAHEFRQEHGYGYRLPQELPSRRQQAYKKKSNLLAYFRHLQACIDRYGVTPDNMYNMDETGVQVNMVLKRMLIRKWKKSRWAVCGL